VIVSGEESGPGPTTPEDAPPPVITDGPPPEKKKYYVDGGQVEIAAHLVYELDADGKQLRVRELTDYTAEKVRTLSADPEALRAQWADPGQRAEIVACLEERGIDFRELAKQAGMPDAEPLDLLCHVAFNAPLRTRKQRADRVLKEQHAFFERYRPEARAILSELLDKYAEHGSEQFVLPDVLKVPPISKRGQVADIIRCFGGADELKEAVEKLQQLIYAA